MSTSQPFDVNWSRSGLRYPLPVAEFTPQVIEAPRGRTRRGTLSLLARARGDKNERNR